MSSFNKVILLGNLTRDPELRYTPKGSAIAKIGMAVNRKWRSETGEEKEEVAFVDVDFFGKQAENIGQYMRKGSQMLVEGRLKLDQWDDKASGQKRSRLTVVGETCQFIGSRQQGTQAAPTPRTAAPADSPAAEEDKPKDDESVPF